MIQTVVKLDGSREPFNGAKLNAWVRKATGSKISAAQWSTIALSVVKKLPEEVTSIQLQQALIDELVAGGSWSHYLLAGALTATLIKNEVFGSKTMPTIKKVQKDLNELGLMRDLGYSDEELEVLEQVINHDLDLQTPHFAHEQFRNKYAMRTVHTDTEYETQQFTYMRMAMTVFEKLPKTPQDRLATTIQDCDAITPYESRTRLEHVIRMYRHKSNKILSSPTPNYNNLGSFHRGYASCCLMTSTDDRFSLAAADHIEYMMTTQSAGLGRNTMTRSIGEPVQKGRFLHRGKLPYYGASGKHARANIQGGRGGALNLFFESFDPEARVIAGLRDTRAAGEKSNREAHYAFLQNGYFLALAAQNKKAFCWNINTAPDLHKAFYGDDLQEFITIYKKYEADDKFVKTWFDARDLLLYAMTQWASTGTIYRANIDEMNRNTPFIDPIHSSNLCMEISEHTRAYEGPDAMRDLYSTTLVGFIHFVGRTAEGEVSQYKLHASQVVKPLNHRKTRISAQDLQVGMTFTHYTDTVTVEEIIKVKYEPEVALCNLAAINLTEELSEEVYADATYYSLRLVDYCILESEYILPHIGVTAKKRMNAAVGLMGVATHMARRRLKYNSEEGLKEGFRIAERHYWHLVNASLQLSKERGIPDWMERSKRPDGWLPHENAKPYAFTLANFEYAYDWAAKKLEIIANGGLGHTVICAYMPGESSSKALAATNSIYPIRELVLLKTDGESQMRWAAPYGDDSTYFYQSVYDLSLTDMNSWYAVFQIWNDQAISADAFVDFNRRMTTTDTEGKTKDEIKQAAMKLLTSTELLEAELDRTKKGVKTVYYFNTKMPVDDTNSKLPTESIFGTSTEKETPEQLAARLMAEMGGSDERADCAGCSV